MYLLAENEILKEQLDKKGVKVKLSNAQRYKLAKKGKKLGRKGLMEYASIVTPDTILAWHRKLVAMKYTTKRLIRTWRQKRMRSARRVEVTRGLCIHSLKFRGAQRRQKHSVKILANSYRRIQGALSNLGYKVSMTTVGNILRAQGIVPSPERGKRSNWQTFDSRLRRLGGFAPYLPWSVFILAYAPNCPYSYGRHVGCRFLYGRGLDASRPRALSRILRYESSTAPS